MTKQLHKNSSKNIYFILFFAGGRSTSESSSGYDSSEILEMATRAAGVLQAEKINPARRMSRPTVLPIATERYAQRNAQRQRGITQADAKDPLRQTKNTSKVSFNGYFCFIIMYTFFAYGALRLVTLSCVFFTSTFLLSLH
jgi:hypothetical protein